MCVCIYIYIYTYTHIYIHTHSHNTHETGSCWGNRSQTVGDESCRKHSESGNHCGKACGTVHVYVCLCTCVSSLLEMFRQHTYRSRACVHAHRCLCVYVYVYIYMYIFIYLYYLHLKHIHTQKGGWVAIELFVPESIRVYPQGAQRLISPAIAVRCMLRLVCEHVCTDLSGHNYACASCAWVHVLADCVCDSCVTFIMCCKL